MGASATPGTAPVAAASATTTVTAYDTGGRRGVSGTAWPAGILGGYPASHAATCLTSGAAGGGTSGPACRLAAASATTARAPALGVPGNAGR